MYTPNMFLRLKNRIKLKIEYVPQCFSGYFPPGLGYTGSWHFFTVINCSSKLLLYSLLYFLVIP